MVIYSRWISMMILKVTKNKALHSLQTVYFLKYKGYDMDLFGMKLQY